MYHEIEVGSFSYSKPGKTINEDSLLLPIHDYNSNIVFAVADGVGSLDGASQASTCAISKISQILNKENFTIKSAFHEAKNSIDCLARRNIEFSQSATTLTIIKVGKDNVTIGHIGDCRAYIKKSNKLVQITKDHSRYQELIDSGQYTAAMLRPHKDRLSRIITKALSRNTELAYDIFEIPIEEYIEDGHILLSIMSDGAYEAWHKRARFSATTMNNPTAFVNSLRRRIEKNPVDDYTCLSVKLKIKN